MENKQIVTASEIGDFVFCKRGWWLRRKGFLSVPTREMVDGTAEHTAIFVRLQSLTWRRYIAWGFLFIGAIVMVLIILLQL